MCALNISQLVSVGEFQREYLTQLIILREPIAPSFATSKPQGFDISSVDLFTEEGDVPEISQEVKQIKYSGQYTNRAMALDPSNKVTFKFRLDQNFKIWDYFQAWHELSGVRDTAAQVPFAAYIGTIGVRFFNTDKTTYSRTVELHNAFIPKCDKRSIKKGGNELLMISIDIAYDFTVDNPASGTA